MLPPPALLQRLAANCNTSKPQIGNNRESSSGARYEETDDVEEDHEERNKLSENLDKKDEGGQNHERKAETRHGIEEGTRNARI